MTTRRAAAAEPRPGPGAVPDRGRRAVAAALTALVLVAVAGYAVVAAIATGTILRAQPVALLAVLHSEPARGLEVLDQATVRRAVAAMPLDQRIANIAMARDAELGGTRTPAWLAAVARLGWRDTPALQNMLYAATLARDLPRILDVSDALLRRQKLMDQIVAALSLMEPEPVLQQALVDRLAPRPSWRGAYLTATGQLRDRPLLLARYGTIRRLQARGVRLDQGEVAPAINALDRAGLTAYGFDLWRRIQPGVTTPLDDTSFALASASYRAPHDPVPFQWQTLTGEGFSVDATNEAGRTALAIDWDGRGVPLLAQQRTSAAPGRYALAVKASSPRDAAELGAIAFRLVCNGAATPFEPVGAGRYRTAGAVPCSFPVLQITGDVQPSATTHQLSIDAVALTPLAPAGR